MDAVNGAATHQIVGGPQGIDERLYAELRTHDLVPGELQPDLAPVVEGYVTVGDREMQLIGVDTLASAEFGVPGGLRGDVGGKGGAGQRREGVERGRAGVEAGRAGAARVGTERDGDQNERVEALGKWFTERGAVVMAAGAARQLGIARGKPFDVEVGGLHYPAVLINEIRAESAAYDTLLLTDIAQAQEWLGRVGKLSRIDVRVPEGAAGETMLAQLRQRLPPDVQLHDARGVPAKAWI